MYNYTNVSAILSTCKETGNPYFQTEEDICQFAASYSKDQAPDLNDKVNSMIKVLSEREFIDSGVKDLYKEGNALTGENVDLFISTIQQNLGYDVFFDIESEGNLAFDEKYPDLDILRYSNNANTADYCPLNMSNNRKNIDWDRLADILQHDEGISKLEIFVYGEYGDICLALTKQGLETSIYRIDDLAEDHLKEDMKAIYEEYVEKCSTQEEECL